MGVWDGQGWRWVFRWRRNFMQWEKELFESFCGILPLNPIMDGEEDSMVWNNSDSFSIKSFTVQVYKVLYGSE